MSAGEEQGSAPAEAGSALYEHVFEMVRGTGLSSLIEKFHAQGLGDVVSSWVGTGENKPISAEQLGSVLNTEHIAELASKLGLQKDQLLSQLSSVLPNLVNQLTPDGKVPEGGIVERSIGMLKGLLTGFLKRPEQAAAGTEPAITGES
jgi:uncharacterized protein YidB (DUF937 family)